jgi:hypothetical protein
MLPLPNRLPLVGPPWRLPITVKNGNFMLLLMAKATRSLRSTGVAPLTMVIVGRNGRQSPPVRVTNVM